MTEDESRLSRVDEEMGGRSARVKESPPAKSRKPVNVNAPKDVHKLFNTGIYASGEQCYGRSMFAKVFSQIFDSSIAEDHSVRHVFMDLLVLADSDGVIDMTMPAIARRTNVPLDVVRAAIDALSSADTASRTKEHGGRRLIPLASDRDWGWRIVNYIHYRNLQTEESRRDYFREYRRTARNAKKEDVQPVHSGSQVFTNAEAEGEAEAEAPTTKGSDNPPKTPEAIAIANLFNRRLTTAWSAKELVAYKLALRQGLLSEENLSAIARYNEAERKKESGFHRRDMLTLLNNFQGELDRANAMKPPKGTPPTEPAGWREFQMRKGYAREEFRLAPDWQRTEFRESRQ